MLGDMVYGCAFCSEEDLKRIAERSAYCNAGLHVSLRNPADFSKGYCREFADSKKLTEARREDLYEAICRDTSLAWDTESLPATVISQRMLGRYSACQAPACYTAAFARTKRMSVMLVASCYAMILPCARQKKIVPKQTQQGQRMFTQRNDCCRSVKTSLNVLASEATFALIDRALAKGVDLRQVMTVSVLLLSACANACPSKTAEAMRRCLWIQWETPSGMRQCCPADIRRSGRGQTKKDDAANAGRSILKRLGGRMRARLTLSSCVGSQSVPKLIPSTQSSALPALLQRSVLASLALACPSQCLVQSLMALQGAVPV